MTLKFSLWVALASCAAFLCLQAQTLVHQSVVIDKEIVATR